MKFDTTRTEEHLSSPSDVKATVYYDSGQSGGAIQNDAVSTSFMDAITLSYEYPVGRITGSEDEDRLYDTLLVLIPEIYHASASIVFRTRSGVEISDPRPCLEDRE